MTLRSEGSFHSDEVWFNELYKQRPTKDPTSAGMVIYAEGASEQVRQITNVEHFSNYFRYQIGIVNRQTSGVL
jgi:hypothetical protein